MCRRRASRPVADCTISKARRLRAATRPPARRSHTRTHAATCSRGGLGSHSSTHCEQRHALHILVCTAHRTRPPDARTCARPRPITTPVKNARASPTGLTPRLHTVHTAGVGGAGAPAWGVKGGAGRILTRRPAPQNWATTTAPLPNTHARAHAGSPHAPSRTCSRESRTEHAVQSTHDRACVLCSDDSSHGVPAGS